MKSQARPSLGSRVLHSGHENIPPQPSSSGTSSRDLESQVQDQANESELPLYTCGYFRQVEPYGTSDINLRNLDKLDAQREAHKFKKPEAGQCCFLCLHGNGQVRYAVRVPCYRPETPRKIRFTTKSATTRVCHYKDIDHSETVYESDSVIFYKLEQACYQYQGEWKRWIPFYGIVHVREVNVRVLVTFLRLPANNVKFTFLKTPRKTGRLPIKIWPLNHERIRKAAIDTIALRDVEDICMLTHSEQCMARMEDYNLDCIEVQITAAVKWKNNLDYSLHLLKDFVLDPWTANGDETRPLTGLVQETFILENAEVKSYKRTDEVRGIEIELGWQMDRLFHNLPRSTNRVISTHGFIVHGTPESRDKCQDDYFFSRVVSASESSVIDADSVKGTGKAISHKTSKEVVGTGQEQESVELIS
ncbi:hypothetical protein N0V94_003379 [Neodidymelliopsis sp. IMI 364377]|nr:hypothetical protein N0V94_003379 [Neodidymelliopsis sp. IMI 364377]